MTAPAVLDISGVSKWFPGVWAMRGVTFAVAPGEVHGLVGENGAGKSTLMAVASGALIPEEGTVRVAGRPILGDPEAARESGLAIVRQEPALMPELTVAENLYLGMPASKRPRISHLNDWAGNILRQWDADTTIDPQRRVEQMNSEQRFIIEITKALATEPRVLILDEPTEHLLIDDVERLFGQIRRIAASGAGIVYISHRIREVKRVTDRITVLRDGITRGTFASSALSETQIVELIVGKDIDHEYPTKRKQTAGRSPVMAVVDHSGAGFGPVSLEVNPGEIFGLGGMDGNGKREFMRALAGITPAAGRISVAGKPVSIRSPKAANANGVHYLSGSRAREGIFASMSVKENFSFRSLPHDSVGGFINGTSERRRVNEAIQRFEIKTPSADSSIATLSGGNQQKVTMAGVLAAKPKVLLVDEPTQGVDVGARSLIYDVLTDVAEDAAVVLISSDAAELAGLCDRVAIFSRGQIVQRIDGAAVTENAITQAVLTSGSTRERRAGRGVGLDRALNWLAGYWAPIVMVTAVILLLGLYAATVNEHYLTARNLSGIMAVAATLVIVACAQQMLLLIGSIDLSVGPLMGLVVVVQSFFLSSGMSPQYQVVGWVIVVLVAVFVGLTNWALIDLLGLHPMVATLATFMAIQATSLMLRPVPDGIIDDDIMDTINYQWGAVPVTLIVAIVTVAALELMLLKTSWGIRLRAFGSRPEAARLAGISPRLVKIIAYVSCSVIAALAAIAMMGQIGVGDPKSGTNYSLASIAAAVVGGASLFGARGSFVGALVGAFLISQVNAVTGFIGLNDAWRSMLLGVLIVVAVAFYSRGRQLVVAR